MSNVAADTVEEAVHLALRVMEAPGTRPPVGAAEDRTVSILACDALRRDGTVAIEEGTATYGSRDGAPFLHGHVLWHDDDDSQRGGHVLPSDCRIGRDCEIAYAGCEDIAMDSRFDPETNFTLFAPYAETSDPSGNFIVAQIGPNEDLVTSLEQVCSRHGVRSASISSLIGSTVGARFEDSLSINEVPTEILGLSGRIEADRSGRPVLDLEIALIDAQGNIHRGKPKRNENPVLICVEPFFQVHY